ncbi:hypothetical protein EHQ12_05380 [Leptospira gomenensis]|uniref:hypothetical protein n=1 Tax=Leptospira gomenensis TaxID=2484974 RepID=UPI00109167A7|nr:hypothetical protein [Leptospira gomenensis]TGK41924.1 hypothetical protein EHQ12_05380 [Leptospira gomenensis]
MLVGSGWPLGFADSKFVIFDLQLVGLRFRFVQCRFAGFDLAWLDLTWLGLAWLGLAWLDLI